MIRHITRLYCVALSLLWTAVGAAPAVQPGRPPAPTPAAPTVAIQEFPLPHSGSAPGGRVIFAGSVSGPGAIPIYKILCPLHLALRPELQAMKRTPTMEPYEECIEDSVAAESYPE